VAVTSGGVLHETTLAGCEGSHDIRTLNSLVATIIDNVDGYSESAKDVDSPRFSEVFLARADERRDVCTQLRAEVSRLGGEPEDDGTILAAGHWAFVNLKSIVATPAFAGGLSKLRAVARLFLRCAEVGGTHFARAVFLEVVGDALVFLQRAHAGFFDRGDVDERIGAALIRLDEAKALHFIEPLDGANSHVSFPSPRSPSSRRGSGSAYRNEGG
jgi:Domain of unknown function (DUF2383)